MINCIKSKSAFAYSFVQKKNDNLRIYVDYVDLERKHQKSVVNIIRMI